MEADDLKKISGDLSTLIVLWSRYLDRQQHEEDARMEDKAARAIEEGIKQLRTANGNGNGNGNGHPLSERQEKRIKELFDDWQDIQVGRATIKFVLWFVGAFGVGFFTSAAAFIFTGHWK